MCRPYLGFDNLNAGTDGFLQSLISRFEDDLAMSMASLATVRIDTALRTKVADTLVPAAKIKVRTFQRWFLRLMVT